MQLILGFEERQALMNDDIPLPFGLPAVSRLQAANDCFQDWPSHSGQIGNVASRPQSSRPTIRTSWPRGSSPEGF
jgi:hypothetical protein